MNSTSAAAASETIGLWPPAPSAAALREALPETAKPPLALAVAAHLLMPRRTRTAP